MALIRIRALMLLAACSLAADAEPSTPIAGWQMQDTAKALATIEHRPDVTRRFPTNRQC